jgi:hypothetical protein
MEIQRALVHGNGASCGTCPGRVPVVLRIEAECLIANNVAVLTNAREASLRWLISKHDGIQMYEGITNRPYTREEKARLAGETEIIRTATCPYSENNTCILHTKPLRCLCSDVSSHESRLRQVSPLVPDYGPLPTYIVAKLDKSELLSLIQSGEVPDAVLALSRTP